MVDSGTLKLVDEKRMLGDISSLKKARKTFASFRETESSINADRETIASLRTKTDDPESKSLYARSQELQNELNGLREQFDKVNQNRNSLIEKRNEARKVKDDAYNALWKFKNEFYTQKKEYTKYQQEERQKSWERRRAEREAYDKERRQIRAAKKLEEASEPAFSASIAEAESLLAYFDPTFKPSEESFERQSTFAPQQISRKVELPDGVEIFSAKSSRDEQYFVGKKGKKGRGAKRPSDGESVEKEKFTLNMGIVDQLTKLSIGLPSSKDEVPATVESLKAKISWFHDNQERITAENIAKATAEIEKLEKEAASGESKENGNRRVANKQVSKANKGEKSDTDTTAIEELEGEVDAQEAVAETAGGA